MSRRSQLLPVLALVLVALGAAVTPGWAQEGAYSVSIQIDPREGPPTDARPFQLVIDIAGTTAPGRVRPPAFPSI
ncbi:MAG TPA: hypothetical protein VMV01_00375, partial [Planctomycetota bacterium]|nr:hypothetical protein [Planctomycetota bacterium]